MSEGEYFIHSYCWEFVKALTDTSNEKNGNGLKKQVAFQGFGGVE